MHRYLGWALVASLLGCADEDGGPPSFCEEVAACLRDCTGDSCTFTCSPDPCAAGDGACSSARDVAITFAERLVECEADEGDCDSLRNSCSDHDGPYEVIER